MIVRAIAPGQNSNGAGRATSETLKAQARNLSRDVTVLSLDQIHAKPVIGVVTAEE